MKSFAEFAEEHIASQCEKPDCERCQRRKKIAAFVSEFVPAPEPMIAALATADPMAGTAEVAEYIETARVLMVAAFMLHATSAAKLGPEGKVLFSMELALEQFGKNIDRTLRSFGVAMVQVAVANYDREAPPPDEEPPPEIFH